MSDEMKALSNLELRVQILEDNLKGLYHGAAAGSKPLLQDHEKIFVRTGVIWPRRAGEQYLYDADGKEFLQES